MRNQQRTISDNPSIPQFIITIPDPPARRQAVIGQAWLIGLLC